MYIGNIMVDFDIHVHTHLSACADRQAYIKDYIRQAEECSLSLIGFADHSWDSAIPGASAWYQPQNYQRLVQRRAEKDELFSPAVTVRLGAEGEFANGLLGLGEEARALVDYVIIPHSHTHMKGFVLPTECDTPKKHADYLLKSFYALCSHPSKDLIFGIAHPFFPVGESVESMTEILSYISYPELIEAMTAARQAGLFAELNLSSFRHTLPEDADSYFYTRVLRAAAEAGTGLFAGSDSHSVPSLKRFCDTRDALISAIGLSEDMFTAAKHRILTL